MIFQLKITQITEIKLPKLSLPVFNSKLDEWIEFSDLFSACVHKNNNLSNAQKLQYLKSACKADVLKIINSIPISDANYEIAWELLVERYSNKRDLINALIKKLISQTPTIKTASSLLKLVDITNECIWSLKVLEQNVEDQWHLNCLFTCRKIGSKYTSLVGTLLKKDQMGTLDQWLSFLKDHARTLAIDETSQNNLKKQSKLKVTTLVSMSNICALCKNDHYLFKCFEFLSLPVHKWIKFVKNSNLCYNCLSSLHQVKHCKSSNKCKVCNKSHHSVLHIERPANKNLRTENEQGSGNSSLSSQAIYLLLILVLIQLIILISWIRIIK